MTSLRLLRNGTEAFPAMFSAIRSASSCVAVEMYIVADDEAGREFLAALTAASRRGVQVMVLVDAWGSWKLTESFWDELRAAGGEVKWFRPLRRGLLPFRNHRKLVLIDDRRCFIGGLNIGDEYWRGRDGEAPWRDNVLEIDGIESARLRRSFNRMWLRADTPLRLRFLQRRPRRDRVIGSPGGGRVRFLESGPEDPLQPLRRAYSRVIRRAKKSIDLAMAYFFPPRRVLRALKQAVRRGVRVRLLFPEKSDVPIARWAARGLYGRLLRAGMEVWEYRPAMLHAKLAVADDTVICGSANLDIRSGWLNYELVAAVTDPDVAAKARADFEQDLTDAVPITLAEWKKRPLMQKLKERMSHWLLARADPFVARLEIMRTRW